MTCCFIPRRWLYAFVVKPVVFIATVQLVIHLVAYQTGTTVNEKILMYGNLTSIALLTASHMLSFLWSLVSPLIWLPAFLRRKQSIPHLQQQQQNSHPGNVPLVVNQEQQAKALQQLATLPWSPCAAVGVTKQKKFKWEKVTTFELPVMPRSCIIHRCMFVPVPCDIEFIDERINTSRSFTEMWFIDHNGCNASLGIRE